MNAIVYKNYATLTPIQIRVYDDKIMIANDCVFPEDWTVENLMKPHKSRPYMITFFAGKTTQTPTQTPTQTELSELVLAVIREHPEYSQKQIAEQLDWKRDIIQLNDVWSSESIIKLIRGI